jgi:acetyl-CoA acetyltransferase
MRRLPVRCRPLLWHFVKHFLHGTRVPCVSVQAVYCVRKLGIPDAKVNPNGGAIAMGHPLGCTGARQVATLLHELKRRKGRYGVVSMCIGTGMGAAAVFEAEV